MHTQIHPYIGQLAYPYRKKHDEKNGVLCWKSLSVWIFEILLIDPYMMWICYSWKKGHFLLFIKLYARCIFNTLDWFMTQWVSTKEYKINRFKAYKYIWCIVVLKPMVDRHIQYSTIHYFTLHYNVDAIKIIAIMEKVTKIIIVIIIIMITY